jgi:hypothetical protein
VARLSEVQYAVVSVTATATVVAALTTGKVRVVSLFVTNTTAQTITFKSGAAGTAVTGAMALGALGQLTLPYNSQGWFETAAATLLELFTSGGTLVAGVIGYVQVDN